MGALNYKMTVFRKIYSFYRDGFAGMTLGRSLWAIILVKLAVMFLVLKLFFFPNVVEEQSRTRNVAPAEVVRQNLLDK